VNKIHTTAIATAVGLSVVLGGVALSRSGGDEAAAPKPVPVGALSARAAQLDDLEATLDRQLAEAPKPPAPVTTFVTPTPVPDAAPSYRDGDDDEYESDDNPDEYESDHDDD
jgi:hypothetical protein